MMEYKQRWSESQTELSQLLKTAKKVSYTYPSFVLNARFNRDHLRVKGTKVNLQALSSSRISIPRGTGEVINYCTWEATHETFGPWLSALTTSPKPWLTIRVLRVNVRGFFRPKHSSCLRTAGWAFVVISGTSPTLMHTLTYSH